MGHNPSRVSSADWWVLTTANAVETNGLRCLSKHGGSTDNKSLVTNPMTDQNFLTSAIGPRSAQSASHRDPHDLSIQVTFVVINEQSCLVVTRWRSDRPGKKIYVVQSTCLPLMLYPRRGSREISDILPRYPHTYIHT
jgi:hypothetical protein